MADSGVTEHDRINYDLNNWLGEFKKPKAARSKLHEDYNFPSDKLRDEYIADVSNRDEKEVLMLLEHFLIQPGLMGLDRYNLAILKMAEKTGTPDDSQYVKRLHMILSGKRVMPWEGITWVLDLLRLEPREAIAVIEAYFLTHAAYLPDGRIYGLSDAVTLIRAFYLGLPKSVEETLDLMLQLTGRDLEHLIDELYHNRGYTTELTPKQKDGGRDVIASKNEAGHQITLYIESKNSARRIGVTIARELYGVIESARIEKGLLVGTSGFTQGPGSATNFAADNSRIDLMDGVGLIKLLGETFGRKWAQDIDKLIRNSRQRDLASQTPS
jgi:restriction system protein